jgi:hypothetical protein
MLPSPGRGRLVEETVHPGPTALEEIHRRRHRLRVRNIEGAVDSVAG